MTEAELLAALEAGRDDREVWLAAAKLLPNNATSDQYRGIGFVIQAFDGEEAVVYPEALMPVAMMLKPEGWETIIYTEGNVVELYDATLKRRRGIRFRCEAPYPARALLLAALRARKGEA